MRFAWLAPLIVSLLSGCASLPDEDPDCTNIISLGGGLLKFCQVKRQLDIYDTDPADPLDIESVRVIDDPAALKALQRELPLRSVDRRSKQLIAKACVVKDDTYISMKITDFKRIASSREE